MHIIHIASELAPIAKVGGLADVLLGLPRELSWKKHDVDIILPKYDCLNSNEIRDLAIYKTDLMSYFEGEWFSNTIWIGWVENIKVYFIEPHHPRFFFDRGCYYGCEDDIDRYLYFSRAALEFLYKQNTCPAIIHLHDWQTAIVATLLKDMYEPLGFDRTKLVMTVHNFEYQGLCSTKNLDSIGLVGNNYLEANKLQDTSHLHLINLLKGGIVYSDFVTTVSPTYAQEVKSAPLGRGLETTLRQYEHKFAGILNGIDYSYWNPEIDRHLPAHYSSREKPLDKKDHNTLDKKAFIKHFAREKLLLAEQHRPIVSCITRLVPQKSPELIKHALEYTVEHGGQFILLGSCPIAEIAHEFHTLKHRYADHPHVYINLHLQEELSHLIYACSDMLIVPSLFEPCGLTQLIALKYGTIPIVRRTGGLADTIFDIDHHPQKAHMGNGYTFDEPTNSGIESALKRAFDCWFHQQDVWRKMVISGMNIDFSWNHPSDKYIQVYEALCANEQPKL
jgi:starch synthase